jgi:glycosyltransferase involved in cell wall biosynthesis
MMRTFERPPGGLGTPGAIVTESLHSLRAATALRDLDLDIVHDHTAMATLSALARDVPTVITVHTALDERLVQLYETARLPLVAISEQQRRHAPALPWVATVPNAIDVATYPFQEEKEEFAVFLGRMHPDKAPHLAIDAAKQVGLPLVMAGKCSEAIEREYFARTISPALGGGIEYAGVADAQTKRDLLRRAAMLLFPIQWEEPFGLVMLEAMACGTPVVAMRRGAVPEIVIDGVTGVLVDDAAELPSAMEAVRSLEPRKCRRDVEERFDVPLMAARYETVFRRVLGGASPTTGAGPCEPGPV